MKLLLDSFWRATLYCVHPRVIMLSMLPLVLMAGLSLGLGYLFWERAVDAMRAAFDAWSMLSIPLGWLESLGLPNVKAALAPLAVVLLSTPVIVVLSLLVVAAFMTPAMLTLVAARRFPTLARKNGGSLVGGLFGASWASVAALFALLVTIPLWLLPPLVLIVPPLIWGWLTYRVMTYDVLAEHASAEERHVLIRRHRMSLLAIGVVTGYLGAAPSLLWASGALAIVFAPVLVPAAVWIYTLVFAFASLWFAHYALDALRAWRAERALAVPAPAGPAAGAPALIEDARGVEAPPTPSGTPS